MKKKSMKYTELSVLKKVKHTSIARTITYKKETRQLYTFPVGMVHFSRRSSDFENNEYIECVHASIYVQRQEMDERM